jgi:single-strand DNA-binding protein
MLNKIMLIGNIGRDAEIRQTDGGASVANFSIATNEKWKDRDGELQERVEWHKVVLWGKAVEAIGQYLVKGKQVYVDGSIQTRKWKDRDGNDRTTVEVKANQVKLLSGGGLSADLGSVVEENKNESSSDITVDDIPF